MVSESYQENKKYKLLLETARELFFKHGTKRVSIEEICEKAGVSKMTFYKFFRNKNDIATRVLSELYKRIMKEQDEILGRNIPFIEKIKGFINHSIQLSQELEDIFLDEMLGINEDFSIFFASLKEESYQLLSQFIRQGQEEGVFRNTLTPDFMLYMIDILQEILNSDRMKAITPDPHDRWDMMLNFFFYGIINSGRQDGIPG